MTLKQVEAILGGPPGDYFVGQWQSGPITHLLDLDNPNLLRWRGLCEHDPSEALPWDALPDYGLEIFVWFDENGKVDYNDFLPGDLAPSPPPPPVALSAWQKCWRWLRASLGF
jgi:hypothetical protein